METKVTISNKYKVVKLASLKPGKAFQFVSVGENCESITSEELNENFKIRLRGIVVEVGVNFTKCVLFDDSLIINEMINEYDVVELEIEEIRLVPIGGL